MRKEDLEKEMEEGNQESGKFEKGKTRGENGRKIRKNSNKDKRKGWRKRK